ncbi:hypothetical protein [Paenibacillus elgii]|uniref:hypothetical protein n=1 Tax=Paenibacillus elgii TaxID=189691 RepID=UPI001CB89CA5|nr:hypothetical protein [Paenibacillus elgii]
MTAPITLEPIQPIYHQQVGRLLAYLLHGKFRHLTSTSWLFFTNYGLNKFPICWEIDG